MSNSNFNQKQQETSNLMTALQLMDAPAMAPMVAEDFFHQFMHAASEDAESLYSFALPAVSAPSHTAPPANPHAAYIFEDSLYTLDPSFGSSPASHHTQAHTVANPTAHPTTQAHTSADDFALASTPHHASAPEIHTDRATSLQPHPLTWDSLPHLNVPLNLSALTSAASATSHWNSLSGWGQADVSSALAQMLGQASPTGAEQAAVSAPWYLQSMGFQTAWAHGYTGQGIVIADIDTGIDLSNTHFMQDIKLSAYSKNFIENNTNIQDDNGHGTVTASELVARTDAGIGIQGGAYGAELMVLKALGADGTGTHTDISDAMVYAVDHGAQVINLSLGQSLPNQTLHTAMQYASDHGVVVVAAAGNQGTVMPEFPAAYAKQMPAVIAVGATESLNDGYALASFSNHSGSSMAYNFVDALGVGIMASDLDGSVHAWNGTSMAAPLVAAEVAVLASTHSGWSAAQIVQDIMQSARTLTYATPAATSHGSANYLPMDNALHAMSYVPTEQYY